MNFIYFILSETLVPPINLEKRTKRITYYEVGLLMRLRIYSTYSTLLEITRSSTLMYRPMINIIRHEHRQQRGCNQKLYCTVLYGELSIIASCCVASLRVRVATKHLSRHDCALRLRADLRLLTPDTLLILLIPFLHFYFINSQSLCYRLCRQSHSRGSVSQSVASGWVSCFNQTRGVTPLLIQVNI